MQPTLFLWAALAAAAVTGAQAQEAEPDPFAADLLRYRSFFDYGGFEPSLEAVFPGGYASRWTLRAGLDATFSDNVDKTEGGERGFWTDGVLGLGWLRKSPTVEGTVDYRYATPVQQTGAVDERNDTTQQAVGALRWRAAEHLTLQGTASLAQNLESSRESPVPGVRSTYGNRSDQYRAQASGDWQPLASVKANAGYAFAYRNYVSDEAEGQDTVSHTGNLGVTVQAAPRDTLTAAARYAFEDVRDDPSRQETRRLDLGWAHALAAAAGSRRSTVRASYRLEREKEGFETLDGEDDRAWWSHTAQAGYSRELSARTTLGADAGYQRVVPDDGASGGGLVGGVEASHRFSERTTAQVSASRSYQYLAVEEETAGSYNLKVDVASRLSERTSGRFALAHGYERRAASSTTDYTVLTRTWLATASLDTRLGEALKAAVTAGFERGDREESADVVGDASGPYWQASGTATLDGRLGLLDFAGGRAEAVRRQTEADASADDYLLARLSVFYRRQVANWLSGSVTYSHERRHYDASSDEGSYRENRLTADLTLTW